MVLLLIGNHKKTKGTIYLMAQGTHENAFFLFLLTIYKEKVREMNKKQVIRINENQLKQIVTESVKKLLNEWEDRPEEIGKQEDDNYYGGGLPEGEPIVHNSSCEKKVTEIYNEMLPYIDALAEIFNNNDCDDDSVYRNIMNVLEELDKLPLIGKHFTYSY